MLRRSTLPLVGLILAACGGNGGSGPANVPPPELTDAQRTTAATATVADNPKCAVSTLGGFYWEIGDADGVKASGSVGSGAPAATTPMWVFSASKWLYAASVVEKRGGVRSEDVPFLNFTSGYTEFGNLPVCLFDTVESCHSGWNVRNPANVGHYFYDSGHMQFHAATMMGLGDADNDALAADLNATIGDFGFDYTVPQPAAGVVVSPQGYAGFLRKLLRGELALGAALGTQKKCADPSEANCDAVSAPELGAGESWRYSLGHWVEDDPVRGDHAFSSAGGGGFYPWIDATKTYYGIVARERSTESDAGFHSAECGRLIRQAWMTGIKVTTTAPTP